MIQILSYIYIIQYSLINQSHLINIYIVLTVILCVSGFSTLVQYLIDMIFIS